MSLIEVVKIVFLGIVEGITEWLPISSTGHMILFDQFIKLDIAKDFKDMFFVVIQLGAIMAVVVLFWRKLWPFTKNKEDNYMDIPKMRMWVKILIATIPSVLVGLPLNDWMDANLMNSWVVAATLILYGFLFIYVENKNRGVRARTRSIRKMTFATAAFIGAFQMLAIIPGTSRLGATILGAIMLGCSRTCAAEFSFYLAIPTMLGASILKIFKFGRLFTGVELFTTILGMGVAFGVSYLCIKFLMNFVKTHDFKVFGYYRIVLGAIVLIVGIITAIAA